MHFQSLGALLMATWGKWLLAATGSIESEYFFNQNIMYSSGIHKTILRVSNKHCKKLFSKPHSMTEMLNKQSDQGHLHNLLLWLNFTCRKIFLLVQTVRKQIKNWLIFYIKRAVVRKLQHKWLT